MKILLLSPGKLGLYGSSLYPDFYPRLGLRILAALSPLDCEVQVVEHERVDQIPVANDVDLVGISVLTPFANQAYALADAYRALGVKVVLGGVHPTIMPEEAKIHADSVVAGEAETLWPKLVRDVREGCLHTFYCSDRRVRGDEICRAKRYSSDERFYKGVFHVEAGRGCRAGCDFCVVSSLFGDVYRPRPVESVIQEALDGGSDWTKTALVFSDNVLGNPRHSLALCEKTRDYGIHFSAEGDLPHLNDSKYLRILGQSGCRVIYVETDAYSRKKHPAMCKLCQDVMAKIVDSGMQLVVNFTLGGDDHDESIFDEVRQLVGRGNIAQCFVQLLVPWPGTPVFRKLEKEGRIITRDWSRYNNSECVYIPKRMTREQMMEGYHAFVHWMRNDATSGL